MINFTQHSLTEEDAMSNTKTSKTSSTKKTANKEAPAKKVAAKKAPAGDMKMASKNENGKGKGKVSAVVQALRKAIVKNYPQVPSVDDLVRMTGMAKALVTMYRQATCRTLKMAAELGRLR